MTKNKQPKLYLGRMTFSTSIPSSKAGVKAMREMRSNTPPAIVTALLAENGTLFVHMAFDDQQWEFTKENLMMEYLALPAIAKQLRELFDITDIPDPSTWIVDNVVRYVDVPLGSRQ